MVTNSRALAKSLDERVSPRTPKRPWLLAGWTALTFGFLYLPIIVLVVMSFNDSRILSLPLKGFTLGWYQMVMEDVPLREALVNSLKVAGVATILATTLGLLAGFAIYRYRFFGRNAFRIALNLPILLPGIVTGVAMLAYFSDLGWELSLGTVILGHAVFGIPVALGPILTRLGQFPRSLEEAAYDLGAKPAQVYLDVVFPFLRSALIAAALLAFTLSFDEVVVTIFLTGRDNTLPMEIWARLRTSITPEIAAIATLILGTSTALVLLSEWATSRE
ncbi:MULTISPECIES: ABC transporter permease [unclassified Leptolyngbya]|uniref:ABC transporter permease n=1 Tax=unclassified Leptolyngbya TaxID=2650499 RepID=UPI001684C5C1|nr:MULTISPECIES: ABC transporter permease [unclassified Leptolyngbya]MBD1913065.1 ABC transporter permease [Leptolyngbya sp. FACHB-8]MBD2154434.1 ABC transporter permease [Leptolyngbya sp. FACHB-16]